jgi:hypothetical protein
MPVPQPRTFEKEDLMPTALLTKRSEHQEQCAVFDWAELMANQYPELDLMFAIPNGGVRPCNVANTPKGAFRYSVEGKKMKQEGVKKGVPDILLPVPKGIYHGLFIEMKRSHGGVIREEQDTWLKNLAQQGYFVVVCKGANAAMKVLKGYLSLEKYKTLTF